VQINGTRRPLYIAKLSLISIEPSNLVVIGLRVELLMDGQRLNKCVNFVSRYKIRIYEFGIIVKYESVRGQSPRIPKVKENRRSTGEGFKISSQLGREQWLQLCKKLLLATNPFQKRSCGSTMKSGKGRRQI